MDCLLLALKRGWSTPIGCNTAIMAAQLCVMLNSSILIFFTKLGNDSLHTIPDFSDTWNWFPYLSSQWCPAGLDKRTSKLFYLDSLGEHHLKINSNCNINYINTVKNIIWPKILGKPKRFQSWQRHNWGLQLNENHLHPSQTINNFFSGLC